MTGDDEHHPDAPIELSEAAESAQVDQDTTWVETDRLREVVAEDLGKDDDDKTHQPTKPSQPQNVVEEATYIPCVAEEVHSWSARPLHNAEECAQVCNRSAKPPHHAEERAQAQSLVHQPGVEVKSRGKTINDRHEGIAYRDVDAQRDGEVGRQHHSNSVDGESGWMRC